MKTNNRTSDVAILFFTRSAAREARAKQLIENGSFSQKRSLARAMIAETERLIRNSGYPVRVITSERQRGNTFGERFADAFRQLFDEGFERVLSIGNDCLQIDAGLLSGALRSLERMDMVIGPAADGGAYMIGMHRKIFDRESFASLQWQTPGLLEDLLEFGNQQSPKIVLLEKLSDIDHPADLMLSLRFIAYQVHNFTLAGLLYSIIYGGIQNASNYHFVPAHSYHLTTAYSHRGPPSNG